MSKHDGLFRWCPIAPEELWCLYHMEHKSQKEIAEEVGRRMGRKYTNSQVSGWMRQCGVAVRCSSDSAYDYMQNIQKSWRRGGCEHMGLGISTDVDFKAALRLLFVSQKYSLRSIAQVAGVSHETVRKWLNDMGVDTGK